MRLQKSEKILRSTTIGIIIYLLSFGIVQAFFPVRPFWNDEWRLIYNIKFKEIPELWGKLDLLQECPRIYLSALKIISATFDYSYLSLRLPPLLIGTASIFFIFFLRKKIFQSAKLLSYLFILILVSSQTFTDYLVQVKQYEMDIFLCLLALWQLYVLLQILRNERLASGAYLLFCLTFLVTPYFSYIYPIVIAPIFPVILISYLNERGNSAVKKNLLLVIVPLTLVSISILIFYLIDVKNVMADTRMYASYLKAYYQGDKPTLLQNFWNLFALVGSGFVFEFIFGFLGVTSFIYAIRTLLKKRLRHLTTYQYFELYAVCLLILVLFLLASGKIVGGVARLTAYTVPSISILIISLLEEFSNRKQYKKLVIGISFVVFLGLFGNVISSCINVFTYPEYKRRINTYHETARALNDARTNKLPLMYTDGVCGDQYDIKAPLPGKIEKNMITQEQIAGADTLCGEVIVKVNPAYKVWDPVPLYYMPDKKWTDLYFHQLPEQYEAAIVGDGLNYKKLER